MTESRLGTIDRPPHRNGEGRVPARVLWLIKGLGLGGAETLLAVSAPHVDRSRFECEVAYLLPWKNALVPSLEAAGVRVTCLGYRYPFDLRIIGRIVRMLRERQIDVLHAHLPYSGVMARIAGRLAGVPCSVYTEHSLQERHHRITRIANQATMRLCDRIIAVSDQVRDSIQRSRLARRARVGTILNGVDAEKLRRAAAAGPDAREELSIPPTRLVVGVVSVFRPEKRLDLWIQAARIIADAEPRATFVVVGEGPTRGELRGLADSLGLNGRVIFTGLRHDAPRLMTTFDVFMLSSIYEGLPIAVLEAMALSRPVVATRVGGLPGLLHDGVHGFLVDARNPAALAEKVLMLLRDPDLRQAMGQASKRRVEEHFSIQRMVRETEQVYAEILDDKSAARQRWTADARS